MQLTDKDGNVFGTGGLEITSSDGKPKIPVINTDITIGTTAIVGGVAGRLLYDNAGIVGETNGVHWDKVNSRMGFGTTTPAYGISHIGNIGVAGIFSQRDFGFGAYSQITQRASYIAYTTDGTTGLAIGAASGAARIQGFNGLPATSDKPIFLQSLGGNVGIGTTTDAGFKLDVNGTARIQGAITQSANQAFNFGNGIIFDKDGATTRIFGNSGTINYQVNAPSSIQHRFTNQGNGLTSTGTIIQIDSHSTASDANSNLLAVYNQTTSPILFSIKGNGNVGIGTASPTSILDAVVSNGAKSGFRFRGYSDASTPYLLSLGTYTYSDIFQITSVNGLVSLNNTSLYALALGTNNTERLRITSTGNVLIGTSTDSGYKLNVNGSVYFQNTGTSAVTHTLLFRNENSSYGGLTIASSGLPLTIFQASGYGYLTATGFSINSTNSTIWTNNGSLLDIKNAAGNTTYVRLASTTGNFLINTTTDAGYTLDINGTLRNTSNTYLATTAGSVGIGTTSPSAVLHIQSPAGGRSTLVFIRAMNSAAEPAIQFANSANNLAKIGGISGGGLYFENATTELMRISSTGNLLLNTTTDTGYTLNVNGTGYFGSNLRVNGTITASTPTANTYICHIALTADQVLVSGADALLDFVDIADTNNWYDPTTKKFLPAVAGYYHVDFSLWFEPSPVSTGQYNIQVRKNGTTVMIAQQPTINNGTGQSLMSSKLVYFNGTTDYIDFTAYQSTGSNRNIWKGTDSSGTYATIFLLAV